MSALSAQAILQALECQTSFLSLMKPSDELKFCVGILLGSMKNGVMTYSHSYQVPYSYKPSTKQIILDSQFLKKVLGMVTSQHNGIGPFGWFCTNNAVSYHPDLMDSIDQQFKTALRMTKMFLIHFDTALSKGKLTFHAYQVVRGSEGTKFQAVPLQLLDDWNIHKQNLKDPKIGSANDPVKSIIALKSLVSHIKTHIQSVVDEKSEIDYTVGQNIWNALGSLPRLSTQELQSAQDGHTQKLTTVQALATMSQAQVKAFSDILSIELLSK